MAVSFAHAESHEIGGQKSVAHPTQTGYFAYMSKFKSDLQTAA